MKKRLIIFLIVFVACKSHVTPSGIIEPEKMKSVLWDVMRADEMVMTTEKPDSIRLIKEQLTVNYAKVFALHKITADQFYKSYKYYQSHPILHKNLMDSVYAYGNRERSAFELRKKVVKSAQ